MAHDQEAERYRKAAHLALDQLDWCVSYLRSIRKTRLSQQVAKNRSAIVERLQHQERGRPSRH